METLSTTTNYSIFKKIKGNRPLDEIQIRKLMSSFKKRYLFSPIIVNKNYEIIDGQHRLEAALRLNLPVNYIIIDNYSLEEVQLLNTNTKTWGKKEFLNSYCDIGLKPYLQMREFMRQFPEFGIFAAEVILTNNCQGSNNKNEVTINGKSASKIKNFELGQLKIIDLAAAYEIASKILEYKELYDGFHRRLFVHTMASLFKNKKFDHELFIKKLKLQPSKLVHCQSVEQYTLLIEQIYNFRNHHKVNLRFS